jgi:hypothetical protein
MKHDDAIIAADLSRRNMVRPNQQLAMAFLVVQVHKAWHDCLPGIGRPTGFLRVTVPPRLLL